MTNTSSQTSLEILQTTKEGYLEILKLFDEATSEALAVGQAIPGRVVDSHVGYGTYIFAQMCSRAVSIMRAVPHSRWVQSDFYDWAFSSIAGHARSILEALLFFSYLMSTPESEDEVKARISVLYLYDCSKRLKYFTEIGSAEKAAHFAQQELELRARLEGNAFFQKLPIDVQKKCKSGRVQMILNRDEALKLAGFEKKEFDVYYDLLSQNTHILSMGYFNMEPNGRGTGLENDADRNYMSVALLVCRNALVQATDLILGMFPDAAGVRQGIKSHFSPGPKENVRAKRYSKANPPVHEAAGKKSPLTIAIREALGNTPTIEGRTEGFWLDRRANHWVSPGTNIPAFS